MKAKVGDFLVMKGTTVEQHDQRGEITEVRSADGSPPYVVRWLANDHRVSNEIRRATFNFGRRFAGEFLLLALEGAADRAGGHGKCS